MSVSLKTVQSPITESTKYSYQEIYMLQVIKQNNLLICLLPATFSC